MKIQLLTNKNDSCEAVLLEASPVEYLIINSALKQFKNNAINNITDKIIAERILDTEMGHIKYTQGEKND